MLIEFSSLIFPFFPLSPLFLLQGGGGSGGAAGGLKFTVADTCERIKEEFNFIQQQNHSWVFLFSFTRLYSSPLPPSLFFFLLLLSTFLVYSSLRVFAAFAFPQDPRLLTPMPPAFPRLSPVSRSLRGTAIHPRFTLLHTDLSLSLSLDHRLIKERTNYFFSRVPPTKNDSILKTFRVYTYTMRRVLNENVNSNFPFFHLRCEEE